MEVPPILRPPSSGGRPSAVLLLFADGTAGTGGTSRTGGPAGAAGAAGAAGRLDQRPAGGQAPVGSGPPDDAVRGRTARPLRA